MTISAPLSMKMIGCVVLISLGEQSLRPSKCKRLLTKEDDEKQYLATMLWVLIIVR